LPFHTRIANFIPEPNPNSTVLLATIYKYNEALFIN
jgi:hypothetical protein